MKTLYLGLSILAASFVSCGQAEKKSAEKQAEKATLEKPESIYPKFEGESGSIAIRGTIEATNNTWIKLYETEGKDYFLVDSAQIQDERFQFVYEAAGPGIYKIGLFDEPNKLDEIILNPSEPEIELNYSGTNLLYGLSGTSSTENQALKDYQKEKRKHTNKLQQIRQSREERLNKRQAIYDEQAAFKAYQDRIANEYDGTFFANMVRHLQSPNRFEKNTYWDDMDFSDVSLIHSTVWPNRIEDYMRLHASQEKSKEEPRLGFYNSVDLLASKIATNGSDEVLEFVLYTLSEGFYSSNMEDLSLYVIDNYFYGDACGDAEISELFKRKAAGIRKLQVGNIPPDFSLPNTTGSETSFKSIAENNEFTLVLFWASFCHKCEQEIPQIQSVYNQYKSKGFEVLAISVDTDRSKWMEGILTHAAQWANLSDLKGWRSPVAEDFRVSSTPVMFLVNRERKIVARPKTARELQAILAKKIS